VTRLVGLSDDIKKARMRGIREGEGEIRDAMPTSSVDEPPIKYASETTTPPERVEEDDQSVVSKFEEEMGAGTKIFKDDSAETSDIEEPSTNLDPFEELVPQETDDPKQGKGPKEKEQETKPNPILKPPRATPFPEDPNPSRQGVAPLKEAGKNIPPGARWTKINRRLVSPAALEASHERFEERDDYVIVLRVLTREEIEKFAALTAEIRGKWNT